MLLLFWNGSGTTTGAVMILPMAGVVTLGKSGVSVAPLSGGVKL